MISWSTLLLHDNIFKYISLRFHIAIEIRRRENFHQGCTKKLSFRSNLWEITNKIAKYIFPSVFYHNFGHSVYPYITIVLILAYLRKLYTVARTSPPEIQYYTTMDMDGSWTTENIHRIWADTDTGNSFTQKHKEHCN